MPLSLPSRGQGPTCLAVQHVIPERPYRAASALEDLGVEVEVCHVFAGERLPGSLEGYAGMVVMGGPMSAASDEGFPTRLDEVELLEQALDRRLPVLGVCLGAQLLAVAAGAKVYRGPTGPEIGWGPVRLTEDAADDPLFQDVPTRLEVLHWHGDTFDLPPGAVHLASSPLYQSQAFRVGPAAWGLQFHLEVDQGAVDAFLTAFGDEARAVGVSPAQLGEAAPAVLQRLSPARDLILSRFASLVLAAQPVR